MRVEKLILGVDPGTTKTGYALVEEESGEMRAKGYGAIRTPRRLSMAEKLSFIFQGLGRVIEEARPDAMAIEAVFFAQNPRSALLLGQARGVAILAAAEAGLSVYEYTPLEVKQAVVGYGRAPKVQIQEALKLLLGLSQVPEPEDAADALAVALCHLASRRMRALESQGER